MGMPPCPLVQLCLPSVFVIIWREPIRSVGCWNARSTRVVPGSKDPLGRASLIMKATLTLKHIFVASMTVFARAVGGMALADQPNTPFVSGDERARQQHYQQSMANEQAQMRQYDQAYATCLRGRGYTVSGNRVRAATSRSRLFDRAQPHAYLGRGTES
jgi:hypothetical protein